jgi:predicted GIY-YIG superfamily endonuclease
MAFWVYILRCADDRFYTGHTDNLEQRLAQHQHGGFCDFTSRRRPVTFVWSESFPSRIEAMEAERQIKGWTRAKKDALIRGDWPTLSWLAKPPKERPSTSLRTNGEEHIDPNHPFVLSEVEARSPCLPPR